MTQVDYIPIIHSSIIQKHHNHNNTTIISVVPLTMMTTTMAVTSPKDCVAGDLNKQQNYLKHHHLSFGIFSRL
jgi:hypothetical protein